VTPWRWIGTSVRSKRWFWLWIATRWPMITRLPISTPPPQPTNDQSPTDESSPIRSPLPSDHSTLVHSRIANLPIVTRRPMENPCRLRQCSLACASITVPEPTLSRRRWRTSTPRSAKRSRPPRTRRSVHCARSAAAPRRQNSPMSSDRPMPGSIT